MTRYTPEQIAKMFGCTTAQVGKQFAANAAQLQAMAKKAKQTGRKVNGYTAAELAAHAARFASKA